MTLFALSLANNEHLGITYQEDFFKHNFNEYKTCRMTKSRMDGPGSVQSELF